MKGGEGKKSYSRSEMKHHVTTEVGFSRNKIIAQMLGPLKCYFLF